MNASRHPLLSRRTSGVLLHPTSLPGPHGSGDLGPSARHFVDWLAAAGQTLWQILPLHPVGAGHSPYQSPSAFAGNPLLVDLDDLVREGWLPWQPPKGFDTQHCEFERVIPHRMAALRQAWRGFDERANEADRASLDAFCASQAHWLDDHTLFMVLDHTHGGPWTQWPHALARRDPQALAECRAQASAELGFWAFVQWRFWTQWQRLRQYAHQRGVHLVGDVPIFVAHHSADVWANAGQYLLDPQGEPQVVAGVPPDYFSATGQRWGNPLFNWAAMAQDGYRWWKQRLGHLLQLVDLVRLDHFRGFDAYWAIPAHEPTALAGEWHPGPGMALFDALTAELGPLPIIAEDLGHITDGVRQLLHDCGLPGMRVLQFAFGGTADNPYLPHNHTPASVVYTGTHDNDTTVGWWHSAAPTQQRAVRDYLGPVQGDSVHWTLMRMASQSVARTCIVPFQDVLGLDGRHRMNTPGLATGCWTWRFEWSAVGHEPAERLRAMASAHGRLSHPPARSTP